MNVTLDDAAFSSGAAFVPPFTATVSEVSSFRIVPTAIVPVDAFPGTPSRALLVGAVRVTRKVSFGSATVSPQTGTEAVAEEDPAGIVTVIAVVV